MKSTDVQTRNRQKRLSPSKQLEEHLVQLVRSKFGEITVPDDIPKKWEKHGDLVLISSKSLINPIWSSLGDAVWDIICNTLKCCRIARKHNIKDDNFRSPCTEILRGSTGWVHRMDNGIKMTFDVTKCMFSSGNISEKIRIAKFDCHDETVVDLYAGIGYFTLPFLIHAKAKEVHACEWNPHAIAALQRNLALNNVADKCVIHQGDNRVVCPKGIANRVNLGLIPSSEAGWETACMALKIDKGGMLHVHGIVTSGEKFGASNAEKKQDKKTDWTSWAMNVCESLSRILQNLHNHKWSTSIVHIEYLKSYAPHIDHVVADICCKPSF